MEIILSKPQTEDMQAKAEATFKRKELQAREASVAMAEYTAMQTATRLKTERLKALRLAKEDADAQKAEIAAETKAAEPKTAAKTAAKRAPARAKRAKKNGA